MNAFVPQVEDQVEMLNAQGDHSTDLQALEELTSIELAYVGGGTFVATFV